MPDNNSNNFISDFKLPNRSNSQPRREQNYRQPSRPIARSNYTSVDTNQPATQLPSSPQMNEPQNSSSTVGYHQPAHHYKDNEFISSPSSDSHINTVPVLQPMLPLNNSVDNMSLDDDLDSLFPKVDNNIVAHKVGADLVIKQARLPKGVYLIFILSLMLLPLSFFIGANTSLVISILMSVGLILSALLLFKIDIARKFMIYLSIGVMLITIGLSVLFYMQSSATKAQFVKNFNTIKSPDTAKMSIEDKKALASAQAKIITNKDQQIKARNYFYILGGFLIVENVIIFFYLRKPKVKSYFVTEKDNTGSPST